MQPAEGGSNPAMLAKGPTVRTGRQDPLRRFTPTPYASNLLVMGSTIRLESNSRTIIERAENFFARHQGQRPGGPHFLWRIIGEPGSAQHQTGVELEAFSEPGLRYANMGQRSFFAVDLRAREAVAYLDEESVEAEPTLHCRSPFDTLFCMCAARLGKTTVEAACIAEGEQGVLIFGPPNSGKTTTSYLAAKMGLDFHADQAAFVEMDSEDPRVWGDLLPAVFRPEALQFLPELRDLTRQFCYPSLTMHYLSKKPFQSAEARPVRPTCCVFLNRREFIDVSVAVLAESERLRRLEDSLLYLEDSDFQDQTNKIVGKLALLPAYELRFGDPLTAAACIRNLLVTQPRP